MKTSGPGAVCTGTMGLDSFCGIYIETIQASLISFSSWLRIERLRKISSNQRSMCYEVRFQMRHQIDFGFIVDATTMQCIWHIIQFDEFL